MLNIINLIPRAQSLENGSTYPTLPYLGKTAVHYNMYHKSHQKNLFHKRWRNISTAT